MATAALANMALVFDQTELIYKDAKPSFNAADQEPELIKTNFRDYDVSQLKSLAFQTVLGVVIIAVMHFKYGYLRPLLLQSVLAFKTLYGVPLIKVHILGFPATGELQRPWKAPNPLGIEEPATAKEVKKEEKKQEKKKISSKKHD
ncbi:hypothetical protein HDV02_000973 [Globomyces sp. JEL0801]|nr:hypothetical protein HDV02_000973 [Globomyces sp. JEL0801]